MKGVSVLTLVSGRRDHLVNLMLGLMRQSELPDELIIAAIGSTQLNELPTMPFPVRQVSTGGSDLPLAAARNCAAELAEGKDLVFLDVDCIPGPSLCADYRRALRHYDSVLMGEVLYLPANMTKAGWSIEEFDAVAVRHSDRRGPPAHGIDGCDDYRCFWSLNFAMRKTSFHRVGGFDEQYRGYGGEDTDFAKTFTTAGVPLGWIRGARAYHQYHPHHMPPVHHLRSIVRNAQLFEAKWGYRTMGHWLHAFRLMRLIDDMRPGEPIRILREPNAEDLALTRQQSHQPYANTMNVIRMLESRERGNSSA
jgi:GT2 family glycosyltransferase